MSFLAFQAWEQGLSAGYLQATSQRVAGRMRLAGCVFETTDLGILHMRTWLQVTVELGLASSARFGNFAGLVAYLFV